MRKKKSDVVCLRGYFPLLAFFVLIFLGLFASLIYNYIIKKESIKFAFFLLIFLMIIFGGVAVFMYAVCGDKAFIHGDSIIIKKWYGIKKVYDANSIKSIRFEKEEDKIFKVIIITEKHKYQFNDEMTNFDKLIDYCINALDESKIEYI